MNLATLRKWREADVMRISEYLNSTLTVDFRYAGRYGPATGPAHEDGDWIIHRPWPEDQSSIVQQWYVTHRATKRLVGCAPSLVLAKRMIKRLDALKIETNPDGRAKAGTREKVFAVLSGLPVFVSTEDAGWVFVGDIPRAKSWAYPE